MNQKNQLNNNKNTKKRFFIIIISGIIAMFLLIAIVLFAKKSNHKAQEPTTSENNNQPAIEKETNPETNQPAQEISPADKEQCPYLNEQNLINKKGLCEMPLWNDNQKSNEDLIKWRQIPQEYIIKLWKKGYHWNDILQLWGWNLPPEIIPNLKAEKSIGVINTLSYLLGIPCSVIEKRKTMSEEEKNAWKKKMENEELGVSNKAIFIVRKSSSPTINFDRKIHGASPYGNTLKYVEKLVKFAFQQENINSNNYEISVLSCIGAENFGKEGDIQYGNVIGKSIGVAYYLGLLSAIHQKPINQAVAATGVVNLKERKGKINEQEVNLSAGAVLPIAGLRGKTIAGTEKGVSRLVLSKYNSSPNLLSQESRKSKEWIKAEDYQSVVFYPEIKQKLTVNFVENTTELRKLLLGGELS
ncbi:S16 family serine protease [endosymbiont GvMRE of Glomus versiforme]|uniref:S16 family serine protease n=1 Tax=endosymbiont GvMRE of Glomus versiforme TaxID=2039283 RepID=UPI000EEB6D52|nr:S16 family serine protease [endosymbiont GvMRE of Glomus versiforme]RHZ37653.1 hypothetical protein GvMRE_I1g176 [endosymbiont GvMRE of Glomus versiforme]